MWTIAALADLSSFQTQTQKEKGQRQGHYQTNHHDRLATFIQQTNYKNPSTSDKQNKTNGNFRFFFCFHSSSSALLWRCVQSSSSIHTHTHTARILQRQRDTATHARIDALDKLIDAFGETIRIIATSPPPPPNHLSLGKYATMNITQLIFPFFFHARTEQNKRGCVYKTDKYLVSTKTKTKKREGGGVRDFRMNRLLAK